MNLEESAEMRKIKIDIVRQFGLSSKFGALAFLMFMSSCASQSSAIEDERPGSTADIIAIRFRPTKNEILISKCDDQNSSFSGCKIVEYNVENRKSVTYQDIGGRSLLWAGYSLDGNSILAIRDEAKNSQSIIRFQRGSLEYSVLTGSNGQKVFPTATSDGVVYWDRVCPPGRAVCFSNIMLSRTDGTVVPYGASYNFIEVGRLLPTPQGLMAVANAPEAIPDAIEPTLENAMRSSVWFVSPNNAQPSFSDMYKDISASNASTQNNILYYIQRYPRTEVIKYSKNNVKHWDVSGFENSTLRDFDISSDEKYIAYLLISKNQKSKSFVRLSIFNTVAKTYSDIDIEFNKSKVFSLIEMGK